MECSADVAESMLTECKVKDNVHPRSLQPVNLPSSAGEEICAGVMVE